MLGQEEVKMYMYLVEWSDHIDNVCTKARKLVGMHITAEQILVCTESVQKFACKACLGISAN